MSYAVWTAIASKSQEKGEATLAHFAGGIHLIDQVGSPDLTTSLVFSWVLRVIPTAAPTWALVLFDSSRDRLG
jgi:hypothetical protein